MPKTLFMFESVCMHRSKWLGLAVLCALLQACVFVPVTTQVYDSDCHIVTRQWELKPVQVSALGQCHSADDCGGMLVVFGASAAVSAIVSGSIVVVGNVAFWFEKQGRCVREQQTPTR